MEQEERGVGGQGGESNSPAGHAVVLRDSRLRSVLKGLTWRIVATLTTITIAFIITGKVDAALQIGGVEFVAKFFIYYVHERAWAAVPLGTIRKIVAR